MRRLRVVGAIGLAVFVLYGTRGHSQTSNVSSRIVIDRTGPRAIERGISPLTLRSPDDPLTRRQLSVATAGKALDRRGASGAPYRAGKVIVKFRDGATPLSRVSALRAVSRTASMAPRPDYADFDIITIDPNEDAEATAALFRQRSDVEYAQAAYRVRKQFVPNDRYYPQQWNLPLINVNGAWDIQPAAGSAIIVAVVDSGVAYTNSTIAFHASAFTSDGISYPALGNLSLQFVAATELQPSTRFVSPHDFIWGDNVPVDLDGHGTHVSGTIGQLTNNGANGLGDVLNGGGTAGIAFNVKLMPVKVIDGEWDDIFGSPNGGTDDIVAQGIRYAVDSGAKIINMSIGRTGPPAPAIEAAIRYAVCTGARTSSCSGSGVFVAIAGGNDFEDGNPVEVIAEIASRIPGAVSVAAVDPSKAHAFYSNTGSYIELSAPGGSFRGFDAAGGVLQQTLDLDLVETFTLPPAKFVAPRFDTLAYFFFTGTSMATPHVSGVAAMLMQQGITDPAAIEAALEKFAVDLGSPGRDDTFGFGLVDARNTLRGLGLAR